MASFGEQMKLILDRKIRRTLNEVRGGKMAADIGDFAADQIVKRTRLGTGVRTDGGPEGKFIPLADSTYTTRKKKKRELSSKTRPKKSNLTFSGKMLDSIISKVKGSGKILIQFKNARYDNGKSVNDVASYHDKLGASRSKVLRPFFNLSIKDKKKVLTYIRKQVRILLKKK